MSYNIRQFDSVGSDELIVIRNGYGDYTWGKTLKEIQSDQNIVVNIWSATPHYYLMESRLNNDNILVEENQYDSDPILELPSSIPERYRYGTLFDGTNEMVWDDNAGLWSWYDGTGYGDWKKVFLGEDTGDGYQGLCWRYYYYSFYYSSTSKYRAFYGQCPEDRPPGEIKWQSSGTSIIRI